MYETETYVPSIIDIKLSCIAVAQAITENNVNLDAEIILKEAKILYDWVINGDTK